MNNRHNTHQKFLMNPIGQCVTVINIFAALTLVHPNEID